MNDPVHPLARDQHDSSFRFPSPQQSISDSTIARVSMQPVVDELHPRSHGLPTHEHPVSAPADTPSLRAPDREAAEHSPFSGDAPRQLPQHTSAAAQIPGAAGRAAQLPQHVGAAAQTPYTGGLSSFRAPVREAAAHAPPVVVAPPQTSSGLSSWNPSAAGQAAAELPQGVSAQ